MKDVSDEIRTALMEAAAWDRVGVEPSFISEAGEEEEGLAEFRGLEEELSALGVEVVDDSPKALKEQVYKRVLKRIIAEQKKRKKDQTVNKLVDNIFERIQKTSKKRRKK